MENLNSKTSSAETKRDLNQYAAEMGNFITELKVAVGSMSDEEVAMMIEENKVCKAMFQQVFNVLVIEQTNRINKAREIEDGLKNILVQ